MYVRLGTVRPPGPPLPWKKCSHSSDAGLRVVHPERDLERDEDLLVVEDRAALDSILDTLDTQLPCLEGVPPPSGLSSSSAPGTFIRVRWYCPSPKMGILMPPSTPDGLDPRDMIDRGIWGALDPVSRATLSAGVSGVLTRVWFMGCSYADSSSLSSLPLVPIHTPMPTGIKPLRLPLETVQNLLRRPLR